MKKTSVNNTNQTKNQETMNTQETNQTKPTKTTKTMKTNQTKNQETMNTQEPKTTKTMKTQEPAPTKITKKAFDKSLKDFATSFKIHHDAVTTLEATIASTIALENTSKATIKGYAEQHTDTLFPDGIRSVQLNHNVTLQRRATAPTSNLTKLDHDEIIQLLHDYPALFASLKIDTKEIDKTLKDNPNSTKAYEAMALLKHCQSNADARDTLVVSIAANSKATKK